MSPLSALLFEPIRLEDTGRIYRYTSVYGEGSCQHSPVSMYSLWEKYEDCICERDGFLYTLRRRLCDETYRVYLAPLGGGDRRQAFETVFADAQKYGKKAKFLTLTETAAAVLEKEFPGRFNLWEDRNLAEYFYRAETMAGFLGGALKKRRVEAHTFWNRYGSRAVVGDLCAADFPEVLAFTRQWLEMNRETHDAHALEREERMIEKQLQHYDALGLSGVTVRIDGDLFGYGYGVKLSDRFYDAIAEKGDRRIPYIYRVLRMEATKRCAVPAGCEFVNMEEDVGIPGLRALKNAYKPDFLLRKYVAIERDSV